MAAASRWLGVATGFWHLEQCIGHCSQPSPWCTLTLMCLQDKSKSSQHSTGACVSTAPHAVLTSAVWGFGGALLKVLVVLLTLLMLTRYSLLCLWRWCPFPCMAGSACCACGAACDVPAQQMMLALPVVLLGLPVVLLALSVVLLALPLQGSTACSACGGPCSAFARWHSLVCL